MSNQKLVRVTSDKKIAGVCSWIAQWLGTDPTIIRIGFVFATVFGFGSPILVYIILALVIPKK